MLKKMRKKIVPSGFAEVGSRLRSSLPIEYPLASDLRHPKPTREPDRHAELPPNKTIPTCTEARSMTGKDLEPAEAKAAIPIY
jgi:hypothetical protein